MACPRFALRLLCQADSFGNREALIGDLLEEVASGRSRFWLYRQVLGLYGFALVARARTRARLTPHAVALVLGAVLLGGLSVASVSSVLETWLAFYGLAGTLSLFAHMISHTIESQQPVISGDGQGPSS
jgi:hypothetical protein